MAIKYVICFAAHNTVCEKAPDHQAGTPAEWGEWPECEHVALLFEDHAAAKAFAQDHWSEGFVDEYLTFPPVWVDVQEAA